MAATTATLLGRLRADQRADQRDHWRAASLAAVWAASSTAAMAGSSVLATEPVMVSRSAGQLVAE